MGASLTLCTAAGDERSSLLEDVEIPFLPDVPVMAAIVEHDAVERVRRLKPLSLLPLVALIFYDVSGGPFGIEVHRWPPCAALGSMTLPANGRGIYTAV